MTNSKRIAIIDDDIMITKAAKYLLSDNYETDIFESGDLFLKQFFDNQTAKPDLILLDIMMPGRDGKEILREFKNNEDLKDIPVIIVSARSQTQDKIIFAKEGATDYIPKPYDFDELKEKIDNIFLK